MFSAHFYENFIGFGSVMNISNNFCNDLKNVKSIVHPSVHQLCLACLLNFAEQVELACRRGLSDQKIWKGTFVKVVKLSFWESPVKIHDVAGTPNV